MNTPTVSVVTAVGPGEQPFLEAAAESVKELVQLAGERNLKVEWVVGLDGGANHVADGASRTVRWCGPSGIAATRNAALAEVQGEWVVPLDADDQLSAVGVLDVIAVAQREGWGWIGANRLLMDGGQTSHWFDEEGSFPIGELAEQWTSPFPFHPNSVAVRSELILQIGGWPAVRVNEDLAMVLLLSESSGGGRTPAVLTRYRVWDGQQVSSLDYPQDKATAFAVIERIVNVRRAAYGRDPIVRPGDPGGALGISSRVER